MVRKEMDPTIDPKNPTYEQGLKFFQHKFEKLNKTKDREIYTHTVCATDTNHIKFILTVVDDTLRQIALQCIGVL